MLDSNIEVSGFTPVVSKNSKEKSSDKTSSYGRLDQFTESIPFIVFFLVSVLMLSMVFHQDALTWYLVVVLISMILFNQDKLQALFSYIKF